MHKIKHKLTGQTGATQYKTKKAAAAAMEAFEAIHGKVFEIISEKRDYRYGFKDTPSQRGWDRINGICRNY